MGKSPEKVLSTELLVITVPILILIVILIHDLILSLSYFRPAFMKIAGITQSIYELEKQMINIRDEKIITLLNDKECSICMTEFLSNQKIMFCPRSYKHYFHHDCLIDWFKASKVYPKCNTPISIEYIRSRKQEYNINVIEQQLAMDCKKEEEVKHNDRISVIVATKNDDSVRSSIKDVLSVIESQNDIKQSLEPFAYDEREAKNY